MSKNAGAESRASVAALPTVEVVALSELRESKTNPRKISDRAVEVLALALERFGWKQPLVVDGDRVIVAGHTRYRAAKKLGLDRAPVVVADDLTPEEIDAYRIADNRTHDFTAWDLPELATQLEALADDFSDVLALADWEAVVAEFDAAQENASAEADLPEEARNAVTGEFAITAYFETKDQALAAEATIIDLPGAFDVRHNL